MRSRHGDAIPADAVEHGVGEDDAGVAEQQVVARHQHDEHADLRRRAHRLTAREQERGRGQAHKDEQDEAECPRAGRSGDKARSEPTAPEGLVEGKGRAGDVLIGVLPLGAPDQDEGHDEDVGDQRQLRLDEADIIRHERYEDGSDEAAANRTEAADDDDDEHQHHHLHAHAGGERLAEPRNDAAKTSQRRAGDEDAHEEAADAASASTISGFSTPARMSRLRLRISCMPMNTTRPITTAITR